MASVDKPGERFRSQDRDFIALVDGAFVDAAARSGPHLLCRAGCSQCCVGVFAIGPADVLRMQSGIKRMERADPQSADSERAGRVRQRAAASWSHLAASFPGDPETGALTVDSDGEPPESFEDYANQEPCPALDPEHGTCDLYEWRPHTCRVFGPPIQMSEGYGVCELCFQAATSEEIAKAAMAPEPAGLLEALDSAAVSAGGAPEKTIVAFALKP